LNDKHVPVYIFPYGILKIKLENMCIDTHPMPLVTDLYIWASYKFVSTFNIVMYGRS